MSIRDILKTNCAAILPGDWAGGGCADSRSDQSPRSPAPEPAAGPLTNAEIKQAVQFRPGSVEPTAAAVRSNRLSVRLPWPPSVNDYLGRRVVLKSATASRLRCPCCRRPLTPLVLAYKTAKAKTFDRKVLGAMFGCPKLAGAISVRITAYPPDRRRRDLDNLGKCVLDALTAAGAWDDDSQVAPLAFEWGEIRKGGEIHVEAVSLEPTP